ncbi:MAG: VOC family protein [Proteobacteria bacterium]|nr:VOC family protein [Pseudomonadota bacterium]MCP4921879.1 VOC family protein [Pseudomonadota bacterium]
MAASNWCWFTLNSSGPKTARAFYSAVVGWTELPWGDDPDFAMVAVPGGEKPYPIGAARPLPESAAMPSHWLGCVHVEDCDATVALAAELGATVVGEPVDLPGVGRFAIFQDPQGAWLSVISGSDSPRFPDESGFVSWHELATSDPVGARDFYVELFGWCLGDAMDMGPMGTYQMYGHGDRMLGGIWPRPESMPAPPNWLFYVRVEDLEAAAAAISEHGGTILNGPMDVPGGERVVQALDPTGAAFALVCNTEPGTP